MNKLVQSRKTQDVLVGERDYSKYHKNVRKLDQFSTRPVSIKLVSVTTSQFDFYASFFNLHRKNKNWKIPNFNVI